MSIRALTNDATESRTVFVTNAHRGDGKRFVVHADEKLTAFVELESAIRSASSQFVLMSQTRPVSEVSRKGERCVRRNENEAEIEHADFPAEAPESNSDEHEAYKA